MFRRGCELRYEKSSNVKGMVMELNNSCFAIRPDSGKTERFTKENVTVIGVQAEVAHKLFHSSFVFICFGGQRAGKNLNLLRLLLERTIQFCDDKTACIR